MSEDDNYETEKGTKIKINVDTDKISKQVADIMMQQQTGKEKQALESLDSLKLDLANMMDDDSVLDCNTPSEVKEWLGKRTKRHVVSGKYQIGSSGNSQEFDSPEQLMDNLYERAYHRGLKVKTEDGELARKQIEQLFKNMITGRAWQQLKRGEERFPRNSIQLMTCPKCRATINAKSFPPCPVCGYSPQKENV